MSDDDALLVLAFAIGAVVAKGKMRRRAIAVLRVLLKKP